MHRVEPNKVLDKLLLTGQNLGQLFNSRSGPVSIVCLCFYLAKRSNLWLKTLPKQLLSRQALDIAGKGLALGAMTLSITIFSTLTFSITIFDIQHIDIQHINIKKCNTQHNDSFVMLSVFYAECPKSALYAECHYADCRGTLPSGRCNHPHKYVTKVKYKNALAFQQGLNKLVQWPVL